MRVFTPGDVKYLLLKEHLKVAMGMYAHLKVAMGMYALAVVPFIRTLMTTCPQEVRGEPFSQA